MGFLELLKILNSERHEVRFSDVMVRRWSRLQKEFYTYWKGYVKTKAEMQNTISLMQFLSEIGDETK